MLFVPSLIQDIENSASLNTKRKYILSYNQIAYVWYLMLLFPEINRLWSQDFPSQCWFVNILSDCVERPFIQMGLTCRAIHVLPENINFVVVRTCVCQITNLSPPCRIRCQSHTFVLCLTFFFLERGGEGIQADYPSPPKVVLPQTGFDTVG